MRRSLAAIMIFICATAVARAADKGDRPEIDLKEITRRLTEWRASFVNLRVLWEVRTLPETDEAVVDWPPPPEVEADPQFLSEEWIWADHGLDLLEKRSYADELGSSKAELTARTVEAFNGPKGLVFRAQFGNPTKEPPDKLIQLELFGLGTGKPTSVLARTPMRGLYWPGTAQWLPELLSEWKWKLDGTEEIAGEPCVRVTAAQPYITDVDFVEIMWLDLNHDCLVRRFSSPAVARRRAGRDFIVDEFQRLDDGTWFPKRGRIQLGGMAREGASVSNRNQAFVVIEAAVNQSLDLARFTPPSRQLGPS